MVRLKLIQSMAFGSKFLSFNSKMVRLKSNKTYDQRKGIFGLNSKMLRLKYKASNTDEDGFDVSIPKWFD